MQLAKTKKICEKDANLINILTCAVDRANQLPYPQNVNRDNRQQYHLCQRP